MSASAFKQSNGVAETHSLRMRLRTVTQTDHDRLENLMESLDFAVTLENYTSLLLLLLGFHRPLEARLLELDWSETGLNLKERCKSHLLVADLAHLGLDSIPSRAYGTVPICRVPVQFQKRSAFYTFSKVRRLAGS